MQDRFRICRDCLSIHFTNETEKRKSRGDKKENDWNHYGLFHRVANLICEQCRFEPSSKPYSELSIESFPSLWPDASWGGNKYLRFEGRRYPAGFEFKFWYQDSRTGRSDNLGYYDFNKLENSTAVERLSFENVARKVRALFLSLGVQESGLEDTLKGRARVMWKINDDPGRHWGRWEDYRSEPHFRNYNGLDRDKKTIENGQVKYFRHWSGRLMRGQVYHNINNMWWVVLNEFAYTNIANFELFDATAEDFAKRRAKRDTASKEAKVRRKIGTKLFNELKAKGIAMVLEEKAE